MTKKPLVVVGSILAVAAIGTTSALAAGGLRNVDTTQQLPQAAYTASQLEATDDSMQPVTVEQHFSIGFSLDITATEEQKTEALRQIKEQLDEQVAAGRITQEQADKMYAAALESEFTISIKPNGDLLDAIVGGVLPERVKDFKGFHQELTDEQKQQMENRLNEMREKIKELDPSDLPDIPGLTEFFEKFVPETSSWEGHGESDTTAIPSNSI